MLHLAERSTSGSRKTKTFLSDVSRRSMLAGTGAFALSVALAGRPQLGFAQSVSGESPLTDVKGGDATPSLWISIDEDNTVRITCHRAEMGQQTWTAMAQIVADELEADWQNVEIVQAEGDKKYGDQNTDGSRSVRYNFHRLRVAGAAMRHMLEQAAAQQWGIDADLCEAKLGRVRNSRNRKKLNFGELSSIAAELPIPAESDLKLKSRRDWRYMGEDIPSLTVPKIIRGEGTYGIDVDRPGMVHAVIAHPPQLFGTTGTVNNTETLKVPGVLKTVRLPDAAPPALFKVLGGVAVIATDTWSAIQGREALEIEWLDGPNASYNTDDYMADLLKEVSAPGAEQSNRGDVDEALRTASKKITADYVTPHYAHAPMEPVSATAEWNGDQVTCWACVQDGQTARNTISQILSIPLENITVHTTWLGGAFGRKSKPDFVLEAVILAKEMGKPVKVTWTREDDLRHDYFHACCAQHIEGALDEDGNCTAFLHRTAFPSIATTFVPGLDQPNDLELSQGVLDNPFQVPNWRTEKGRAKGHVRIGWLRSVCNTFHTFGVQSFAAELAHAAGRDPKDYLLDLIGPPRIFDPRVDGAKYDNYQTDPEEYPFETGRLTNVIEIAARKARWGRRLPKGHGLGIAAHRSFLTYVATIIEVAVDEEGRLSIPGIWVAADAGTVVNPRHTEDQFEGGTLFGLSNALYGEITVENGAIVQSNFPDWRQMRMAEAPASFEIEIVDSDAPPAGAGEPGTPPAAPALTNAIFDATGIRIRKLPIFGRDGNDRLPVGGTQ